MKAKKKGLWIGLCGFFATLALAIGIGIGSPATNQSESVQAAASSGTPTISMVPGASVRKVEGSPGIKFTARIENYNPDYQYGMLILPQNGVLNEGWEDGTTDYIEALDREGYSYANNSNCTVYTDKATGEKRISFALTNLYDENFALNLVGIPYTYEKGTTNYNYAEVNFTEDARSISYVATMALKYESDLTQANIAFLEKYASGNLDIDQDGYFDDMTGGGDAIITPAEYEIKYTFNAAGENVALKTTKAYPGGSTVSFKYFIPEGTVTSWWGVAWSKTNTDLDIYKAADSTRVEGNPLSANLGAWVDVSFNLPAGGPYYLYFGSEVGAKHGRWMLDGENAYALIKDFKIGDQVHTVGADGVSEMFTIDSVAVSLIKKSNQTGSFVGAPVEKPDVDYMLGFDGAAVVGKENIAMITDKAYSGVKEITFKAMWTGNVKSDRWGLSYTNNPAKFGYDDGKTEEEKITWINCYSPRLGDFKQDAGEEYTYRVTISDGKWTLYVNDSGIASGNYYEGNNYFYFMVCPTSASNGVAFYIDDFSITYADGTVVDGFEDAASTIFVESVTKNDSHGSAAMSYEESVFGKEPEIVEGEYAAKLHTAKISSSTDTPTFITSQTYVSDGTLQVSFDYYTTGSCWQMFGWTNNNTVASIYAHVESNQANNYGSNIPLSDGWTNMTIKIPAGTWYFYFAGNKPDCSKSKEGCGSACYMVIDNFTIGDQVVETFNYELSESIFTVRSSHASGVELADGKVDAEEPEVPEVSDPLGAKILINGISERGQSFVTKNSYVSDGNMTVTFDYYMADNTNDSWWSLCWSVSNNANNDSTTIYAHTGSYEGCGGLTLPKDVQNAWQTVTVTIPAGTWYFYIGGAKGSWANGYVIIDNFVVKNSSGEVVDSENFNAGFVKFNNNRPANVMLAEGKVDFVPGEHAMKYIFNVGGEVVSQVTKEAYAGGSKVSFRYFIPAGTQTKWWGIVWSTSNTGLDIYAAASPASAYQLSTTTGEWVKVEFTLPEGGSYYLYFGSEVGNWKLNGKNAYVLIDNFTVGTVRETFTNGVQDSIFDVLVKEAVVDSELGEGYLGEEDPIEPEEPEMPEESGITGPNSLAQQLEDGTILEFLANGGYAYLYAKNDVIPSNDYMPNSMLRLEGSISYAFEGEKEFAIYFGDAKYLYVSEARVALYNGTELLAEREISAVNGTLRIAVTAGNVLTASVNGCELLVTMLDVFNEIKLVALGGDGGVLFNAFNFTTYARKDLNPIDGVPVYLSSEQIDFTAYNFDSEAMVSEEGFQLLAEAGFTKTLGLQQGRFDVYGDGKEIPNEETVKNLMDEVNRDAARALTLAEKYGLTHYVLNGGLYNIERATGNYQWVDDLADLATYTMSEAFAGHYLTDEPAKGSELEELVVAYKKYKQAFPEGEAFINLLPNTNLSLSSDDAYTNYVKYYIENIALDKDGVKGTGYVSFDHYPLEYSILGTRYTSITSSHLRNLEIVAELCRDYGLELRTYIKASTTGDTERRISATKSVNDLYMQIYSALAYGSKEIIYYQFTDQNTKDGTAGDAVISGYSLQKNTLYSWTKQANTEVKAFSSAYMNFTWKSVSVFGKTNTQFNNLKSKASAYGYLTSVSSLASILVGNFDDADGRYTYNAKNAYMVVNYGDTGSSQKASELTMTFNGTPNRALVYENGAVKICTLSNNQLKLSLELGEGAFVIPYKA